MKLPHIARIIVVTLATLTGCQSAPSSSAVQPSTATTPVASATAPAATAVVSATAPAASTVAPTAPPTATVEPLPAGYEGSLDGVNGRRIHGWVWDSTRPDSAIEVDIYDGDTLLATVVADLLREDLLKDGKGNGKHAFELETPASLLDGKPHVISVTLAGSDSPLKNVPQTVVLDARARGYQGFHDEATCDRISGWAWNRDEPNTPISVDIYDGDTLLASVPADILRQSLSDKGNGEHGFAYKTPDNLKDGRLHTIRVTFGGTTIELNNTPQTFTCAKK